MAKAKPAVKEEPLEKQLWKAADKLRKNIDAADYKQRTTLSNGDQLWAANFAFPQGQFGTQTLPIVWGTWPGEFNLQVIDTAQQVSAGYPVLRSGNFPAR